MIRQKTFRDERRRRVLSDERLQLASQTAVTQDRRADRQQGRARRYAEAALARQQPRVHRFLPLRPWTITLWFLGGLAFVIAHATVFALDLQFRPRPMGIELAPAQIVGPYAMSNWTASIVLLLAAIFSAAIVHIRQHRLDDYRGDYRLWYYLVVLLVLASVNASTRGHVILWQIATNAIQVMDWPLGSLWIDGFGSLVFTGLAVRIFVEVRCSRGTAVTGVGASLAYLGHAVCSRDLVPLPSADLSALVIGLSRLIGHYLLMMSLLLYARYVFLDAQGLVGVARTSKRKRRVKSPKNSSGDPQAAQTKSDERDRSRSHKADQSGPEATQAATADPPRKPQKDQTAEAARDEGDQPDTLKLTKAERRRLRKQKRRERRAA